MNIPDSDRLAYSLMNANDAELLFELDQDSEVMRFINGGKPTTRAEIDTVWIPRMKSYADPQKGWGLWKVLIQETDEFIGWILVRPMYFFTKQRNDDNLELGWRLKQKAWGKGYATEAATAVMNELAAQKVASIFSAIADEENLASIGIMKKLGMEFVKTYLHEDATYTGDVVLYERNLTGS